MYKFKNNFKENKFEYAIIILICLLGFVLRMINLDKTSGMWLDEANTYNIARQSFPFQILHTLKYFEPHTPLYYFILHFWMKLFGEGDCTLRFLSVIFGTLTIFIGYLAGKELDGKFTGKVTASLICCNSVLIYYSQEVRMYSLVSFLVLLSVYFLIKIKNNPSNSNYICLILTNILLLYSYFTAFILIFLQAFIMSIYLYLFKRADLKKYIYSILIVLLLFLPYVPTLIYQFTSSLKYVLIWRQFNYIYFLYIFQEWFSPIPVLLSYASTSIYKEFFTNPYFVFLGMMPVVIYFIGIFSALARKRFILVPFFIGLSFLLVEILSIINNKMVLESRYFIIILPVFILVAAYGLTNLKVKYFKTILICSLVAISLTYIIFSPASTPKFQRGYSGYKSVAKILKKHHIGKDDMILAPMATQGYRLKIDNSSKIFLGKYLNEDEQLKQINIIPLNIPYIVTQNVNPNDTYTGSIFTNYEILKEYIYSPTVPKFSQKYFKTEIYSKIKKGHYLCLALLKVDFCNYLKALTKEYQNPDALNLYFLSFGKTQEDLIKLCDKYLKRITFDESNDSWRMFIYKKE